MRTLFLVAAVVLAGCGGAEVEPFEPVGTGSVVIDEPWTRIIPGMTSGEVTRAAGSPCEVRALTWDPAEIWIYRPGACSAVSAWCVFITGGVVDHVTPGCQNG